MRYNLVNFSSNPKEVRREISSLMRDVVSKILCLNAPRKLSRRNCGSRKKESTFGVVQIINQAGILIGTWIPGIPLLAEDAQLLAWTAIGIASALMISAVFLTQRYPKETPIDWPRIMVNKPSVSTPAPVSQASAEQADALEDLIRFYSLTKQESKIFMLLVEGRNIPYISEQLCVAQNTTKTHVRHIYEKMQVHSRQELLDLAKRREVS